MPIWIRIAVLFLAFLPLCMLSSLVVLPFLVVTNLLMGSESLLASGLGSAVAQLITGCAGAVWLSGKIWTATGNAGQAPEPPP